MRIRYSCTYRCTTCGLFTKKNMNDVHETMECKTCHRTSDLVEGSFTCTPESKRILTKTQSRLKVI